MREFQYVHAKGIPFFKDQRFDLSRKGISVILGLNTNSGKTGNTNFVGKSYFFSQILETLTPGSELSNPKDKLKTGSIEVGLKIGKHEYVVNRKFKSPEKMTISKDGQPLDIHTLPDAKAYAEKLVGHSASRLSLLMYLDNTKQHAIRTGDTGVRRAFFTDFFRLTFTDKIRKMVKEEKDSLKAKAILLEELRTRLVSLKAQAGTRSLKVIEHELADATLKAKDSVTYLESVREMDAVASFIRSNSTACKYFSKYHDKVDDLHEELRDIKKNVRTAEGLVTYKAELAEYKRQQKKRQDYLGAHGLTDFDYQGSKRIAERLLGIVKQAQIDHFDQIRVNDRKVLKKADLEGKLATVKNSLKTLKKEGSCSKCGQSVTNAHYRKERADLLQQVEELNAQLETIVIEDLGDPPEKSKKLERLEEALDLWRSAPGVPEKPEAPEGIDTELDVEALRERQTKVRDILLHVTTIVDSGYAKHLLAGTTPLAEGEFERALQRTSLLSDKVSRLTTEHERQQEISVEGKEVSRRLKELKAELDELEVLEVMEQAYAVTNGGIKQTTINNYCSKLAEQVNKYSRMLLPEDYTFDFDLQTQFAINVTRNIGGKQVESDVRKLSGAESACFNLVLTMSLLTFVPPRFRPSILVLDELNANFSAEMTASFIRFLPVLNQVIPHVIVITPKTEDSYGEGVKYFTVVKKGANSTIVEGKLK